jgi:hypothetical protein
LGTWSRASVLAVAVLLLGAIAGLGVAGAARGTARRAVVTSVVVSGSPERPVFTISGHGLTVPARNPKAAPARQPSCPLKTTGTVGFDFGTSFYLIAWDGQPNATNAALYSAGRYRPALNELDCIGIVVLSHTPTKVMFTFGHAYTQFGSQYRALQNGDVIEVGLDGAAFATVVNYRRH